MRQSLVRQSFVNQGGSHVYHMHADSLLIQPSFSSKLMITWLNIFKNSFWSGSNQWRWIKYEFSISLSFTWSWIDQKLTFDPPSLLRTGSKMSFRKKWVTWSLILKRNSGGSKVSRHWYASRDNLLHILYWIKSWTPAQFYISLFLIKVFSLSLTSD